MAGFTPNEGEILLAQVAHNNIGADTVNSDRAADLQMGLFTDVNPTETITLATIAEPTGGGYARIALTDANWVVSDTGGGIIKATYAQQTFTAGVGGYTGSIYGYFICTNAIGTGAPRLIYVEVDPDATTAGGYVFNENHTYKITPSITVS